MINGLHAEADTVELPVCGVRERAVSTRIEVYRDLTALQPVWRKLEVEGNLTVFQSWPVFEAWTRYIAGPQQVTWLVIGVHDLLSGSPLMLLPLATRRDGGLQVIEFADLGVSDFNGPVSASNYRPDEIEMRHVWSGVLDVLPAGDLLRLSKMPDQIGGAKNPLLVLPGIRPMKLSAFGMPVTDAGATTNESAIGPALLKDIEARTRKLEKRGRVVFSVTAERATAEPIFAAMCEYRAERHAALNRQNILSRPETCDFYRALFGTQTAPGPALISSLAIDGDIIATGYGLAHGQAFHMIFPAFKADRWRNYSPGLQLFMRTIKWARQNGFTYFDFTIGAEQFKRDFGAIERPLYEKLTALSPRGLPSTMGHHLKHAIRQSPRIAGWVMTMMGLHHATGDMLK